MVSATAKEALCQTLSSQGVEYIFGNPGTTELPFLDALARFPSMHYVLALHESVAVSMADGYARASGRPGIANIHAAPGVANSLGMLFNARRDRVPVVLLAGQQFARSLLREPMLSADLVQMTEQFAKWSYQVQLPEEAPLAIARALKTAMQPPRGPVFLALPRDLMEETIEVDQWASPPAGPAYRHRGDEADIERAAGLLLEARSPVVLAGSGVLTAGASQQLQSLAETLALRVYGNPGVLPWDHPLNCGGWRPIRHELAGTLKDADLLLVVGAPMFREFPPATPELRLPVIHLDSDPWEVGKNYPAALGIIADPKAGLEEISAALAKQINAGDRERLKTRFQAISVANGEARAARQREMESQWHSVPISAGRLVGEMARVLDRDAIIVDEATRSGTYLRHFYPFESASGYQTCEGLCLGWGMGAALGVKLAQPDRQVVSFIGDGSACFAIQALWTAARYQIGVPVIICNNCTYMAIKSAVSLYGGELSERGDYRCADLSGLDFVKLAAGMGVEGRRVERPEDLRPALEWVLGLGKPAVLDVAIDPQDAGHLIPRVP